MAEHLPNCSELIVKIVYIDDFVLGCLKSLETRKCIFRDKFNFSNNNIIYNKNHNNRFFLYFILIRNGKKLRFYCIQSTFKTIFRINNIAWREKKRHSNYHSLTKSLKSHSQKCTVSICNSEFAWWMILSAMNSKISACTPSWLLLLLLNISKQKPSQPDYFL